MQITCPAKAWREKEKYSRIVSREEIAKNDFNISPSRYIHTGAGEFYTPGEVGQIMALIMDPDPGMTGEKWGLAIIHRF